MTEQVRTGRKPLEPKKLYTLRELANDIDTPIKRGRGAFFRWISEGVKVNKRTKKLRGIQVGETWYVSGEALMKFFAEAFPQ